MGGKLRLWNVFPTAHALTPPLQIGILVAEACPLRQIFNYCAKNAISTPACNKLQHIVDTNFTHFLGINANPRLQRDFVAVRHLGNFTGRPLRTSRLHHSSKRLLLKLWYITLSTRGRRLYVECFFFLLYCL